MLWRMTLRPTFPFFDGRLDLEARLSIVSGPRSPWREPAGTAPKFDQDATVLPNGWPPSRLSGHRDACLASAPAEADVSDAAPPESPGRGNTGHRVGKAGRRGPDAVCTKADNRMASGARRQGSLTRSRRQAAATRPGSTAAHGQWLPRPRPPH